MTLLLEEPIAPSQHPVRTTPLLHDDSLARTLDAVSDELFYGRPISRPARDRLAQWIASRPAGYAGMPRPTDHDFCEGVQLFTGEPISSNAGIAHVLGEEACRALVLLGVRAASVRHALERATRGIVERLDDSGIYCCGRCSAALWRRIAAGGFPDGEARVDRALTALRAGRDRTGRWGAFPFFYTVLALTELCHPLAGEELQHAARRLERYLKSAPRPGKYAQRRRDLAERALTIC